MEIHFLQVLVHVTKWFPVTLEVRYRQPSTGDPRRTPTTSAHRCQDTKVQGQRGDQIWSCHQTPGTEECDDGRELWFESYGPRSQSGLFSWTLDLGQLFRLF